MLYTVALLKPLPVSLFDVNHGGRGRIAGVVTREGTPSDIPVSRRVRLHREGDGLLIREVWSSPTDGSYTFDYILETQQYYVVAFDHTAFYNGVIADLITPDIIP